MTNYRFDTNYTTNIHIIYPDATFPGPTARPAIPSEAYLPLTIFLIIFYSLVFLIVYIQLVLILCNKHKRFSYQTVLLFLSLFWSALRISLFSFYFNNAKAANKLEVMLYFLMYCMPIFLQFCTLCLLVSYYGSVYYKVLATHNFFLDEVFLIKKKRRILRFMILICVSIFFVVNLSAAVYIREYCTFGNTSHCNKYEVTIARVVVTDFLFVVHGFVLGYYLFKLARLSKLFSVAQNHKISILKAMLVTIFTSFLLITRTLYNIFAIFKIDCLPDFGFDWINISDQADFINLTETRKFATFAMVMIVWELIPTSVIIFLFRLRVCRSSRQETFETSSLNPGLTRSVFIESKKEFLEQSTESQTGVTTFNRNREIQSDLEVLLGYNPDKYSTDIYTISESINY